MTIELRLIRYAVALGEHGNYARAAEALKITQPSLSRSIASLEAELGVPLFDRGPKGAVPTAFGRVLIDCGDDVMQREAHLRREIALLAGLEQGSLSVGAGPFLAESSAARATAQSCRNHQGSRRIATPACSARRPNERRRRRCAAPGVETLGPERRPAPAPPR